MSETWWQWPLFATGLGTMLLGLYGIFIANQSSSEPDDAAASGSSPKPAGNTYAAGIEGAGSASATPAVADTSGDSARAAAEERHSQRVAFDPESIRNSTRETSEVELDVRSAMKTPPPMMGRERASSRSRLAFEGNRSAPALRLSMSGGTISEVLYNSRLSRAVIDETLSIQVGQSSSVFFRSSTRASAALRNSRYSSDGEPHKNARDSWSRRGSDDAMYSIPHEPPSQGGGASVSAPPSVRFPSSRSEREAP